MKKVVSWLLGAGLRAPSRFLWFVSWLIICFYVLGLLFPAGGSLSDDELLCARSCDGLPSFVRGDVCFCALGNNDFFVSFLFSFRNSSFFLSD